MKKKKKNTHTQWYHMAHNIRQNALGIHLRYIGRRGNEGRTGGNNNNNNNDNSASRNCRRMVLWLVYTYFLITEIRRVLVIISFHLRSVRHYIFLFLFCSVCRRISSMKKRSKKKTITRNNRVILYPRKPE